jgi:hypothetical protein
MSRDSSPLLKKVLTTLPKGMPITAEHLAEWGVSPQLAHRYIQNGWLTSLGYGYYLRSGDDVELGGAVAAMQTQGVPAHVGGKTALQWQGTSHYLNLGKPRLELHGTKKARIPNWLTAYASWTTQAANLFDEPSCLAERLFVSRLESSPHKPYVSEPERAILEVLEGIPRKHALKETSELMEGMYTLRPAAMQLLLEACKKVKVTRLFFHLAEKLALPVLSDLKPESIPFGSDNYYMLMLDNNAISLKNPTLKTKKAHERQLP